MATRPNSHKALVDALVDGELEATELAKRVVDLGGPVGQHITFLLKELVRLRRAGKLTPEQGERLFQELWLGLSLAHFAQVAQEVQDTAAKFDNVKAIAERMGPEKLAVSPIRNEDVLARAQEKLTGEPTNGSK